MKKLIVFSALIAQIIAVNTQIVDGQLVTGMTGGNDLSVGPGTAGFSFTTGSSTAQVQGLGVFDASGTGLTASHEVGLWDTATSTPTLMASALVSATGGTDINNFWYVSVTPITLQANHTYVLGAQYADVDFDLARGNATATLTGAAFGSALLSSGTGFSFPDLTVSSADDGFFGPNLSFAAVPEPSAIGIVTAAGLAVLATIRRWKARHGAAAAAAAA